VLIWKHFFRIIKAKQLTIRKTVFKLTFQYRGELIGLLGLENSFPESTSNGSEKRREKTHALKTRAYFNGLPSFSF